jgi:hypothetical protein
MLLHTTSGRPGKSFAVLRIRDVHPGSRIRIFSIPDSGSEFFPSLIQDQKDFRIRIRIKEFKYFNQKIVPKLLEI